MNSRSVERADNNLSEHHRKRARNAKMMEKMTRKLRTGPNSGQGEIRDPDGSEIVL